MGNPKSKKKGLLTLKQIKKQGLNPDDYRSIISKGFTNYYVHKDSLSKYKSPMPRPNIKIKEGKETEGHYALPLKKGGVIKKSHVMGDNAFKNQYD